MLLQLDVIVGVMRTPDGGQGKSMELEEGRRSGGGCRTLKDRWWAFGGWGLSRTLGGKVGQID
ncbi:hypothetical protein ACSV5M_20045 [Cellvibrio sp. ARAG 10.3]|uniref:hypothetical protein n=1 Tax=Cellvibrio sp. ARAG 10.3 TaxID=3451358 RepID=UPI003F450D18